MSDGSDVVQLEAWSDYHAQSLLTARTYWLSADFRRKGVHAGEGEGEKRGGATGCS
jgi:hypothetical protein